MNTMVQGGIARLKGVDPRVKVSLCLFYLFLLLLTRKTLFMVMSLLLGLVCLWLVLKNFRQILHRFEEPLFVIGVLVILKSLSQKGEIIFSLSLPMVDWELSFYQKGLQEGLMIGLRVLASVCLVTLLKEVTAFHQLLSAFAWFKVPKEIVEILIFADRFMFHLLEEAKIIYTSQRNRLGYVGIKKGLASFATLIGTLILRVFDQGQKVALSMSLRGYDGNMPFRSLPALNRTELLWSGVFIFLTIGACLL